MERHKPAPKFRSSNILRLFKYFWVFPTTGKEDFFPVVRQPGCGLDQPPPYSVEAQEKV
jgi:hypothetical protein